MLREDESAPPTSAVPAHRNGKRFIVRADEKLTAFMEVESAVDARGELNIHRKSRSKWHAYVTFSEKWDGAV